MSAGKIYRAACAVLLLLAMLANIAVAETNSDEIDAELMASMDTYAPYTGGRRLLATCSRSKSKQYYGTKYLLEVIDITGKNRDKSCCWYCSKTCGCKKWDYMKEGKKETCRLFESKARWKKYKGSNRHYGGWVNK